MYGLYPKDKTFGTFRRAGHILRVHLSKDGETSLCGKVNSEKFQRIERPDNNKDICVSCLFAEQKILNPVPTKSSIPSGTIYNLRVYGTGRKEYPAHYTKHFLDSNGAPFCKRDMTIPCKDTKIDVPIRDCEKCLYIIETLENIAQTLENYDNNYQR